MSEFNEYSLIRLHLSKKSNHWYSFNSNLKIEALDLQNALSQTRHVALWLGFNCLNSSDVFDLLILGDALLNDSLDGAVGLWGIWFLSGWLYEFRGVAFPIEGLIINGCCFAFLGGVSLVFCER